jgi:hypothetical protein
MNKVCARPRRVRLSSMNMQTHVYALGSWTIKKSGEKFFIAATAQSGTHRWRGPYTNLQRATTAIARKLQSEFVRRHNRLVQR